MHSLIAGITNTGKTTLAKKLAESFHLKHTPVLVLDPYYRKTQWAADFVTDNPAYFYKVVFMNKNCAVFIDESSKMVGRFAGEMNDIATMGRHNGHKIYYIAQRPNQIDINTRSQCTNLFLFRLSSYDCETLAREFAEMSLRAASELRAGEFICYRGIGNITKGRVF